MNENEREVEIWCKGREREEFLDQDISLLGEWYSEYFNWWFEECGLSNLSFSACDRWMKPEFNEAPYFFINEQVLR